MILLKRHTLPQGEQLLSRLPDIELLEFVEHLPVAVYRTTPSGDLMMANAALVEMLGFDAFDELRAIKVSDLYADPQQRDRLLERLGDGEAIPPHELPLKRRDNAIIWVRVTARAVEDEAGETLYMEGVLEDVTDRHVAEIALEASEELFRSAYHSAPQGLAILGHDLAPRLVNAALCKMLGVTEDEFMIGEAGRFIHNDKKPDAMEKIEAMRAGDLESYRTERRLRHSEGHYVWTLIATSAVRNPEGELEAVISQVFDITSGKRVQQELRESEALFRSTFDDAPIGMIIAEPNLGVVKANPAICRMLRTTEPVLQGLALSDVWENTEHDYKSLQGVLDGTTDQFLTERRLTLVDGTRLWAMVSVSTVHGSDRAVELLLAQFVDVTERHEAAVALR